MNTHKPDTTDLDPTYPPHQPTGVSIRRDTPEHQTQGLLVPTLATHKSQAQTRPGKGHTSHHKPTRDIATYM